MITEEERIKQEQIEEERLRFNFRYNTREIDRAIKKIGREFIDLTSDKLSTLHNLSNLAQNLLVDPNKINSISNFSLSFGAEFEATILINGVPYQDFLNVQNRKFQEVLDYQIEVFARSENLRRPGFVPTDFDYIMGWNTINVMEKKSITDQIVADKLNVKVHTLSFNEVEKYVLDHTQEFDEATVQVLRIYRYIILKSLTDMIVNSLRQIFEDILLVAGTIPYSDITLTVGNQLNIDNKKILETSVEAERRVVDRITSAATTYGAIFPHLRSL